MKGRRRETPRNKSSRNESGERPGKPFKKGPGPKRNHKPNSSGPRKFIRARHKGAEDLASTSTDMRLNRFLAIAGVASRREADELIKMGLVTVNGEAVVEMGYKVKPTDEVRYNGTRIRPEKKVYMVMNKPKGFITTMDDPKARKTVMDLIGSSINERVYPVGRLDRATTGVLMFTNDGDLAKKLTHPSHGARKVYHVVLDRKISQADLDTIAAGIELEDGPAPVDAISFIEEKSKTNVGIELHIGRNRIVRRIFKHMGYEVVKLDRVIFAGLSKKNLKRGQWRILSQKEVDFLRTR